MATVMRGGLRTRISEGLMRVAVWVDPGGFRAPPAIQSGQFGLVEAPHSDPEALRPAVPLARRRRPVS